MPCAVQVPSDLEEMLARQRSHQEAGSSAAGGAAVPDSSSGQQDAQQRKRKEREKQKREKQKQEEGKDGRRGSSPGAQDGPASGGPKLSTAVNLLDPVAALAASKAALTKRMATLAGAGADKQLSLAALEAYPPMLQSCMLACGYVEPTPVQERVWPGALAGRDVQAVAEPGSGKTLAYVLPGIVRLVVGHCPHGRWLLKAGTACVAGRARAACAPRCMHGPCLCGAAIACAVLSTYQQCAPWALHGWGKFRMRGSDSA